MPPEGPNPGHARRGRRNPEIAQALEAEQIEPAPDVELMLDDAGQEGPNDGILVLPGDVVMAKASISVDILGKEAWFSYGLQTRAMEDEEESDVFERAGSVVNTRVLDLAEDAFDRAVALQERHDAELAERRGTTTPSARLQPRRTR